MKSQHFAVGTKIICNQRTGLILERVRCGYLAPRTLLRIRWEDGSVGIIEPIALNR